LTELLGLRRLFSARGRREPEHHPGVGGTARDRRDATVAPRGMGSSSTGRHLVVVGGPQPGLERAMAAVMGVPWPAVAGFAQSSRRP
jgi:hypothetical protein